MLSVSRLCAMNPRTAMDCIACAVMPTAVWLIPVAVQNRITRSCAVSFVVAFAMAYSLHRPARYAAGGGGGGFGGLGGGGFGGFGGGMEATHSRFWPAWRRRQTILHRPVALRYWMTLMMRPTTPPLAST